MTAQNNDLLNQSSEAVADALSKKEAQQIVVENAEATVREYQRQVAYHNSRGDSVNAGIAQTRGNEAVLLLNREKAILADLTTAYNTAVSSYKDLQDRLLTPEEKEVYIAEQKAKTETKLFAAKSTWYIIGALVFVVIVIAGIIVYKRYIKK